MKYDAFISYSHAADGKLAPALQKALHRIAKPWYRIRALNIFRDETDLSATPHLWSTIEKALSQSKYFILLSSPEAADSKWVQKEVDYWLTYKQIDTLLIGLTGGQIDWNAEKNDFDWQVSTSLPKNLKGKFQMEPLYIDFRETKSATDLSLENPNFKKKAAAFAATLHQKPLSNLIGEDVAQQRKTIVIRNLAITLITGLLIAMIAFAWQANLNATEAKVQEKIALERGDSLQKQLHISDSLRSEEDRQKKLAEFNAMVARDSSKSAQEQREIAEKKTLEALQEQKRAEENEDLALTRAVIAENERHRADSNANLARVQAEIALQNEEQAKKNANESKSRYLSTESLKALEKKQYSLAYWLAKYAYESSQTSIAKEAITKLYGTPFSANHSNKEEKYNGILVNQKGYLISSTDQVKLKNPSGEEFFSHRLKSDMKHPSICFSPDGNLILITQKNIARILSINGTVIKEFTLNYQETKAPSFSPKGGYVIFSETLMNYEGSSAYDLSGNLVGSFHGREAVMSPNEKFIITKGRRGGVYFYDFGTTAPNEHTFFSHSSSLFGAYADFVDISYDSKLALFTYPGGIIVLNDQKELINKIEIPSGLKGLVTNFYWASFIPNSHYIITLTKLLGAKIWDARSGKVICTLGNHQESSYNYNDIKFLEEGEFIIIGDNNEYYLYSLKPIKKTLDHIAVFEGEKIFITPDERHFITQSSTSLRIWNRAFEFIDEIQIPPEDDEGRIMVTNDFIITKYNVFKIDGNGNAQREFKPNSFDFIDITTSNTGRYFTASTHFGEIIKVFNESGDKISSIIHESLSYSPRNQWYLYPSTPREKRALKKSWKERRKNSSPTLEKHSISEVVFSPNDDLLLTTSYSEELTRLWTINGKQIAVFKSYPLRSTFSTFEFNPTFFNKGNQIITALSDSTLQVWNLKGEKLFRIGGYEIIAAASVSKEDKHVGIINAILSKGFYQVEIWNFEGKKVKSFNIKLDHPIYGLDIDEENELIYIFDNLSYQHIWDFQGNYHGKAKEKYNFKFDDLQVIKSKFSSYAEWQIKIEDKHTVKIFDKQGEYIGGVFLESEIKKALFTPNHKYVMLFTANGLVHKYKINNLLFNNILSNYSRKVLPLSDKEKIQFGIQ